MKIGIYKIQSVIRPNRVYIGSSVNVDKRIISHRSYIKHNRHNRRMQRHCNKYGINDLKFTLLMECEKEDLLRIEQHFIDEYKPWFNLCPMAADCTGVIRSELEKQKSRSYRHTDEAKRKISEAGIGRKVSEKSIKSLIARRSIPVIDTKTKVIYPSIANAAKNFNIHRRTLENMLHGTNGVTIIHNKTNLQFYKK